MSGGIDPTPAVFLGMVGAALTVGLTCLIAARWKRRSGLCYGISAFVFYTVFYVAAFEYGVLDAIRAGKSVPNDMLGMLVLGHGAITALGVAILTLLVFGLFAGLRPRLQKSPDMLQSYSGCAAFCLIVVVFLNPVGAVERLRAELSGAMDRAHRASAVPSLDFKARPGKRGVDRATAIFPAPGLVRRVDIAEGTVTHYLSGDVRRRMGIGLEAYARMALAHRLYFDNGRPDPVVIRDAKSGRHIATRHPDGRFQRQVASRRPRK